LKLEAPTVGCASAVNLFCPAFISLTALQKRFLEKGLHLATILVNLLMHS